MSDRQLLGLILLIGIISMLLILELSQESLGKDDAFFIGGMIAGAGVTMVLLRGGKK